MWLRATTPHQTPSYLQQLTTPEYTSLCAYTDCAVRIFRPKAGIRIRRYLANFTRSLADTSLGCKRIFYLKVEVLLPVI